jgi:D-beta-D-heptose 7-phosphate kinase/D-beta-D-heptose 1-phosphate adenosyltransferase
MSPDHSLEKVLPEIKAWKADGKKIVFTNGVFDILHVGHVTYLKQAKTLGDILVVGLNDDASVRRLNKGPERPINPQEARAIVLEALECVDRVVIFGEDTPFELIGATAPDVLVKGGDYDPDCTDQNDPTYMVGSDLVRQKGGEVASIPLVDGFSTTGIVRRMRSTN